MATTTLFPGFLTQTLTYGFRIGADQIPGTRNIESLIHQDLAPVLIDPSWQSRPAPPTASHAITGGSQRFTRQLLPPNDLKLSPPDDKPEELSLVGPFRGQSLDRPGRLRELEGVFKSGVRSFSELIEASYEAVNLTAGADAGRIVEALMNLVKNPEAGLTFTFREALKEEWRFHNHIKISMLWMHGLSAILRLFKRGEIEDQRVTLLKEVIRITLNHPWGVSFVRLEEDWPANDSHRVAPYLLDLDRPQRLLLGEVIIQLTEGLDYDPHNSGDHALYQRISHARQILQENERAVIKYLKEYDPKPDQPKRFARLRNLFNRSSRENHRGKRFTAVLQQYRDLYLRLPGRPEVIFRHYPFAYNTSSARKGLEAATKEPSSAGEEG